MINVNGNDNGNGNFNGNINRYSLIINQEYLH